MNSLRISSMGTKRRVGLIALLAVLVLASCVANLAFGAVSIPPGEVVAALLGRESLVVKKKSNKAKAGFTEVDIIPLVRSWRMECQSDTMMVDLVVSAQNPGLNPDLIRAAFCAEYPEYTPDFVTFHRRDVLDGEGKPFR